MLASQTRKAMRKMILTSFGWDGKSEYRLVVSEKAPEAKD